LTRRSARVPHYNARRGDGERIDPPYPQNRPGPLSRKATKAAIIYYTAEAPRWARDEYRVSASQRPSIPAFQRS